MAASAHSPSLVDLHLLLTPFFSFLVSSLSFCRMVGGTFEYVFQQVLWLIGTTAQLIAAMGIGIKWMFMTARCVTFAAMDLVYFMPNVFWYLLSPNIIRRVSYRSSRTTKLRNLEALLSKQVKQESLTTAVRTGAFPWNPVNNNYDASLSASGLGGVRPGVSPSPLRPRGPEEVDRETVERWASSINPADGTFVNGLPVHIGDEAHSGAASRHNAALTFNNSFDDTLEALQRMYRHRSQQQQQARIVSMASLVEPSQTQVPVSVPPAVSNESFTDSDAEDDVEDRMNLHNRATLDIYLPVPLDSLFRFMHQERKSDETAHVQAGGKHQCSHKPGSAAPEHQQHQSHKRRGKLTRKRFPILISVTGGAWIVGFYLWNFLVARLFAARGYVVFCPDYRNFPQTTMEGMTLDVSDAIAWVLNNAERYNGDLNNVTLIGQSAGAHLTMMSLLSQAQLSAYRHNAEKGIHEGVPPPSDVAYNVPRYNPRESIHRYVGLSGIFNVAGLVKHFNRRGLYRDVLYQIAGGKPHMARYTLNAYFDDRRGGDTGEVLPDNIFDFFPQRMFFVHGDADKSAPVTESANIVYVMRNAQRDAIVKVIQENPEAAKTLPKPVTIEYILVPGATHTDSIIEEPLCGNSHIVEFLCYYDIDDDERRHAQLSGRTLAGAISKDGGAVVTDAMHSRTSSLAVSSAAGGAADGSASGPKLTDLDAISQGLSPVLGGISPDARYTFPVLPATRPDGILISPCPPSSRSKLMRLASYICPF
ncbi:putative ecotin [Leishmania infantum JPCM5]|uniref:Isoprenylcysteine_alpha-carbonyl_methylesterase_-_putative n=2 Tax=Leishmania infantum TaxID=5671 RepID=A0A6L0X1X1_LEIIN|nr:putative ecotin [Leishmania infantum JPCM5]CAC9471309.1 Isoprenylcysteine_alpha-carbonyl_methylesterase_-_putative [Leishmania infantum]CAM66757.1 putative ecotin [Leishmania infantum JPCM5]SUZ40428.1 Isoprenylcysteine_alpha-carbonyl_methylesterase_-_putative [Leishmania infantum]|eukprot:XP_001464375.1 putative ecotin [Leishmania infantum JPCM5]